MHKNIIIDHCDVGHVIIVGAGLAGVYLALKLAPYPVVLLSNTAIGASGSSIWAQGGIAAAVGVNDTAERHAQDTILAGAGLVKDEVAYFLARNAKKVIMDLFRMGVPFDQDEHGTWSLGKEGAHSVRRILKVRGDESGTAIMRTLIRKVHKTSSITVVENRQAFELFKSNGIVRGVFTYRSPHFSDNTDNNGQICLWTAKRIVLCTGGMGQLYNKTTNPPKAQGQGLTMAHHVGAHLQGLEFVQFHPTALDIGQDPCPLITEALRGEGAVLVNQNGERFLKTIDERAELAPRDIVSRGIALEAKKGNKVYLDIHPLSIKMIEEHFCNLWRILLENREFIQHASSTTTLLPVVPAAHYHMGGISVDLNGQTSLDGLMACGEIASTGVHGANRLASNSLLEALVFGDKMAQHLIKDIFCKQSLSAEKFKRVPRPRFHNGNHYGFDNNTLTPQKQSGIDCIKTLRQTMQDNVGVIRSTQSLLSASSTLSDLKERCCKEKANTSTFNMIELAELITQAALKRKSGIGAHYLQNENQDV